MFRFVSLIASLLICFVNVIPREYHINERSSLFYKFDDPSIKSFPEDIRINISMSRIEGVLLYSIDKYKKQLIVSLQEDIPYNMIVELNNQIIVVSLYRLCECLRCRYQTLDLRIKILTYIQLQCNEGYVRRIQINENNLVNQRNNSQNQSSNEVSMWLLNIKERRMAQHRQTQIRGCIFNIYYQNRPIVLTDILSNIGSKCPLSCIGHICNGGRCYDDYSGVPICDCTLTFYSGRYCNESLSQMNFKSQSQFFKFESFKLSWKSSVEKIFELKNSFIYISISHNNSHLFFQYKNWRPFLITINETLSKQYVTNREYICIVDFDVNFIEIELLINGVFSKVTVLTNMDLRKVSFDSLKLRSGDGVIGMVHKAFHEYTWHNISVNKYSDIYSDNKTYGNWSLSLYIAVFSILIGAISLNKKRIEQKLLNFACRNNYIKVLQFLLNFGIQIDFNNETEINMLNKACENGYADIVKIIFESGCKSESRAAVRSMFLFIIWIEKEMLRWALANIQMTTVHLLLEKGVQFDFETEIGTELLHTACEKGHSEIVKIVLERCCKVESREAFKQTLLHWACTNNNCNVVKLLLDLGLDIDSKNNNGMTALHIACENGYYDLTKLLINRGSNVKLFNANGLTALHFACLNGRDNVLSLLMNTALEIDARDTFGRTAWSMARQNDRRDCMEVLKNIVKLSIENGRTNDDGWTKDDYRYIVALGECYPESINIFVRDILNIFNNKYKTEILKKINVYMTESLQISINCISISLQHDSMETDIVLETLLTILEDLFELAALNFVAKRLTESILYNICACKQYKTTTIKERSRNICLKYWASDLVSEETKLSSSMLICNTLDHVITDDYFIRVQSYLSHIYYGMSQGSVYLGFTKNEIDAATKKMDNLPEEEKYETNFMNICMDKIKWNNVLNDTIELAQWMEFVRETSKKTLTKKRMENIYKAIKNINLAEYWKDVIIMFVYVRIYEVPSIINNLDFNNQSIDELSKLLKNNDFPASIENQHHLYESLMDFVVDLSEHYHHNSIIYTMVDIVLAFLGYYTTIDKYKYYRDSFESQLELQLKEFSSEDANQIWLMVILTGSSRQNKYVSRLRDYLDDMLKYKSTVSNDMIVAYGALIMNEDIEGIWYETDLRLTKAMHGSKILPIDFVTLFIKKIIHTFKDKCNIITYLENGKLLDETQQFQINFLFECLQFESIFNEIVVLTLLDDLHPYSTNDITSIRLAEVILYKCVEYQRTFTANTKAIICKTCLKYWHTVGISLETKLSSAVLICTTINDEIDVSGVVSVVSYITDILHQMDLTKIYVYLGYSLENIRNAISNVTVNITRFSNIATTKGIYLNTKNKIYTISETVGILLFTIEKFSEKKSTKDSFFSSYFYTHNHGYKLRLQVYPGGYRTDNYMSAYIDICEGEYDDYLEWPCQYSITVSIINQDNGNMHQNIIKTKPDLLAGNVNIGQQIKGSGRYGCRPFISHLDLQTISGLTVNDCVLIKCDSSL